MVAILMGANKVERYRFLHWLLFPSKAICLSPDVLLLLPTIRGNYSELTSARTASGTAIFGVGC